MRLRKSVSSSYQPEISRHVSSSSNLPSEAKPDSYNRSRTSAQLISPNFCGMVILGSICNMSQCDYPFLAPECLEGGQRHTKPRFAMAAGWPSVVRDLLAAAKLPTGILTTHAGVHDIRPSFPAGGSG